MSIPKQDERTPGGKNAPSIVEVARRGWDAARRSAKMTGLSSCGPWEELPKEMRDALTQVATEGWLQGTQEGQDWARKGSFDNAPTDPHHGGRIFNAYGSTDALREALHVAEQNFEAIRKVLVNNLVEPERSAFWLAVRARDAARTALAGVTDPQTDIAKR